MPMPPAVSIELSEDERAQLESWARRRTSAQAPAQRSRIVLPAADGLNNTEIAERLGVYRPMVRKWRGRFAAGRLDALVDEPRPGRPRTIVKTLEAAPKNIEPARKALEMADNAIAALRPYADQGSSVVDGLWGAALAHRGIVLDQTSDQDAADRWIAKSKAYLSEDNPIYESIAKVRREVKSGKRRNVQH